MIIKCLVEQLVGGSRFSDEKTAIKVEDASLEVIEIINELNPSLGDYQGIKFRRMRICHMYSVNGGIVSPIFEDNTM